jgi:WD40 repeat protein
MLSSPIFAIKYSFFRPNILATCEECGVVSIIDTSREKRMKLLNNNHNNYASDSNLNNTLSYHEILPSFSYQAHNNSIFDFDWCFSDNKILTASGDVTSLLINLESGSNIKNELVLLGHTKSIKNVKQAFYNENIIASCGRDGIIFIWDLRQSGKKFCSKNCEGIKIPHIHVIFFKFSLWVALNQLQNIIVFSKRKIRI